MLCNNPSGASHHLPLHKGGECSLRTGRRERAPALRCVHSSLLSVGATIVSRATWFTFSAPLCKGSCHRQVTEGLSLCFVTIPPVLRTTSLCTREANVDCARDDGRQTAPVRLGGVLCIFGRGRRPRRPVARRVTPHPPLTRSPFPHRGRLGLFAHGAAGDRWSPVRLGEPAPRKKPPGGCRAAFFV